MNYQMLKSILDSLMTNFRCPVCSSGVAENNLEIVWAAWNSINLDIICPKCEKHTFVKAEISHLNFWNIMNLDQNSIQEIKQKLQNTLSKIDLKKWDFETIKNIKINDKEILELRDKLNKDNVWVEDFLN